MSSFNFDAIRFELGDLGNQIVGLGGYRGARIAQLAQMIAAGNPVSDEIISTVLAGRGDGIIRDSIRLVPNRSGKSVALVSVSGLATYDLESQPAAFSTKLLALNIRDLAADSSVASIVVGFDSPGGGVTGTPEAADAIYAARKIKPVAGLIDPLAGSAAYWLASQCSPLVIVPSGCCGSIGVFIQHVDASGAFEKMGIRPSYVVNKQSPYKVENNPTAPMTKEGRDFLQARVDETATQFISAVARGRNTSSATVMASFGKGRMMFAEAALSAGLVDTIGDFTSAVMGRTMGTPARLSAPDRSSDDETFMKRSRRRRLALERLI